MPNRWLILAVLFLARTAMGFQFQSVGALSTILLDDLGLSYSQLGTLIGLYLMPGVVLAWPGGLIGQRLGDKTTAVGSLGLMAVGGLIMALGETYGPAAVGRLVGGSGGLMLNVILTKMVADWFVGREIITAMALLLASWPLGVALALVLLGPLATTGSWSLAMYLTTVACLLGLVLILAFYRRPAPAEGPEPAGPARARLDRRDLTLAGLAAMIWMLYNVSFIILPSFGPAFLTSAGFGAIRAGHLTSLIGWILIGSLPLGGYAAERLGRPNSFLIWCTIGACLAVLGLAKGLSPWPLMVALGLLFGPPAGIIMAFPAQVLSPEKRASGMGFFYSFYYLGLAAIPPLAGLVGDLSADPAAPLLFGAMAGLGIIPLLLLFRFFQRRGWGRETGLKTTVAPGREG